VCGNKEFPSIVPIGAKEGCQAVMSFWPRRRTCKDIYGGIKIGNLELPTSINYRFTQNFRVSADRAYKWCTSYDPADPQLMHEEGKRKINQLSEDAIILSDVLRTNQGTVTKTKLVRLNPTEKSWTNTRLSGPQKHSQFLYRITPTGKNSSRLTFVGFQLEPKNMSKKEAAALARKIRIEDSGAWKILAKAMEKELIPE